MEELVIQVGSQNNHIDNIVRLTQNNTFLGRAFNNHIVLNDPYIDAKQINFTHEDNCWYINIIEHSNRIVFNDKLLKETKQALKAGDRLTIGRTELKFFAKDHIVDSTRKLLFSNTDKHSEISLLGCIVALIIMLASGSLIEYLSDYMQLKWKDYAMNLAISLIFILSWVGFWSLIGRFTRQQFHFKEQLFVSCIVFTFFHFTDAITNYAEFSTNSALFATTIGIAISGFLIAVQLKFNLLLATNIKHTNAAALLITISLLGGGLSVDHFSSADFNTKPSYSAVLQPSSWHLSDAESEDTFLENSEILFSKVSQQAKQ